VLEHALREIEELVDLNLTCVRPADDGSDDCSDPDECLLHSIKEHIAGALSGLPEKAEAGSGGRKIRKDKK